ncbi:MAG TPA: FAD-dependent oxidoreductase [Candidatus Acidoferrales bacterium]|nr:FAD-dependent oxidoreductase [Candidatus Acidoferrales bacterium]
MPSALIVGAGPAGALLAYLLARRGLAVTLLERQTDFAREFRGEVLMPSGISALYEAGLRTQLATLPHAAFDLIEIFRGEHRVVAVPIGGMDPAPEVVPQPAMLEMIVAEAAKFPAFKLERGVTVRDLLFERDRVVGVAADTPSGPHEYRADFVIACDGRASVIRKRADLAQDHIMQGFDVVWGHVPGHFLDGRTARGYIGNGHLFILYPSPEGHMQIGWVIDKGAFGDLRKLGAAGWVDAMAPHLSADLRNFLVAKRDSFSHPFLLDVICDRLREWTLPGLLLIGDSAHPMSPVGGQGINVALRDAVVASNHLGRALAMRSDAATLDFAARNIQAERWPEIVKIQDMQQVGPRLIMSNSLLSRVLTSAPAIAFAKIVLAGYIARQFDPFLHGVTRVQLEL